MNFNRVSSPIVNVNWVGWKSNTYELQRAGWQLSVEQNPFEFNFRTALHHPDGLYGISMPVRLPGVMSNNPEVYLENVSIPIVFMARDVKVHYIMDNLSGFQPIDAEPTFINEIKNIEDFKIFRPVKTPEHEIIIPQDKVPELLDKILQMQDPKQKEIREKRRREIRDFMKQSVNIDAGKTNEKLFAELLVA